MWVTMAAMLLLFLAVVVNLAPPPGAEPGVSPDVMLGIAMATSAAGVVLSRASPRWISPRLAAGRGEMTALARFTVAWSFLDVVAAFPLIVYLTNRDWRLLPVYAADVAALIAYPPTRARWDRMARTSVPPASSSPRIRRAR
jgi:hypothetical protein